jgi:hypothetical protein
VVEQDALRQHMHSLLQFPNTIFTSLPTQFSIIIQLKCPVVGSKSVVYRVSRIVKMAEIHEHLLTPNDIRTISYVSEDGQLIRVRPELYPCTHCLFPDRHLNSSSFLSQDSWGAVCPAVNLSESQGGRGDTTSPTGMRLT